MRARRSFAALLPSLALVAAGCGGSGPGAGKPDLRVSAAASLTRAFSQYGTHFAQARARFSFAGSDLLAAQIQRGVRPDVFAAANSELPAMLYARGLVARPVVFTANRLVVGVPAGSTKVRALADLAKPGVRVAIGSASVPVGVYTRSLLSRLPAAERQGILANVRSEEPDVKGVIAKVTGKAVDAGLVYATDVAATSGQAQAIEMPPGLRLRVAYAVAVVKGAAHPRQAQAFVDGLLHGAGQRDLLQAGFLAPGG